MIVRDIHTCNLELIYNGLKEGLKNNIRFFGGNASQLYEHVTITLSLERVRAHELMFLKGLTKKIIFLTSPYNIPIEYKTAIETNNAIMSLQKQIDNDEDITIDNRLGIIPIGMMAIDVLAIFDGMRIGSIIGTDLSILFAENNSMAWMGLSKLPEKYPAKYQLENKIKDLFVKNFYETIENRLTYVDILTDYTISNNFYSYAKDMVNLAHVNSPYGIIQFFSENKDALSDQVTEVKKYVMVTGESALDNIDLIFTITSTFASFFDFLINTGYVINHMDYKIILNNDDCIVQETIMDKYSIRINEINDIFLKEKEAAIADNDENDFKTYRLLPFIRFGQKITYNVKIPFSKIATLGESSLGTDNSELIDIINQISSISTVIARNIGFNLTATTEESTQKKQE